MLLLGASDMFTTVKFHILTQQELGPASGAKSTNYGALGQPLGDCVQNKCIQRNCVKKIDFIISDAPVHIAYDHDDAKFWPAVLG